jgi:hypothetical protein
MDISTKATRIVIVLALVAGAICILFPEVLIPLLDVGHDLIKERYNRGVPIPPMWPSHDGIGQITCRDCPYVRITF